jgi:DNA-directed RNA polymerase specialized sigma subunit
MQNLPRHYVIDLAPSMQQRLNFKHDLLDEAPAYERDYKDSEDRDGYILGHLWLVKDVVMRYRSHFPQTRRFTEDMVSVGLEALTDYASVKEHGERTRNGLQTKINHQIRDFINDYRADFGASRRTNERRAAKGAPLEYVFATKLKNDLMGEDFYDTAYVDILDAVESLAEADREHLHSLITLFLERDHGIDEASLTPQEQAALDWLSKIGENLG